MGASIFFTASGRNVNYDEKQLTGEKFLSCSFYLYRFRKYVSYGFPIVIFCNPGVHYETPCISNYSQNLVVNSVYFITTLQIIPCQYYIKYNFKHAGRYSDHTTGCTTAESFSYYRQGQEIFLFSRLTLGGTRILVVG
jgi:hypothetical protein